MVGLFPRSFAYKRGHATLAMSKVPHRGRNVVSFALMLPWVEFSIIDLSRATWTGGCTLGLGALVVPSYQGVWSERYFSLRMLSVVIPKGLTHDGFSSDAASRSLGSPEAEATQPVNVMCVRPSRKGITSYDLVCFQHRN